MTKTMTDKTMFTCRTCRSKKPLEEFRGDSRKKYGIDYQCKECRNKGRWFNGEYLKDRLRSYKHRTKSENVTLTVDKLEQMLKQRECTYCGCYLIPKIAQVDHIYPLSMLDSYGGGNSFLNVTVSCRSCNAKKKTKHVYEFYQASDSFTDELWTAFVKDYSERLLSRKLASDEVETMKVNFKAEAEDLRRNARPKGAVANE